MDVYYIHMFTLFIIKCICKKTYWHLWLPFTWVNSGNITFVDRPDLKKSNDAKLRHPLKDLYFKKIPCQFWIKLNVQYIFFVLLSEKPKQNFQILDGFSSVALTLLMTFVTAGRVQELKTGKKRHTHRLRLNRDTLHCNDTASSWTLSTWNNGSTRQKVFLLLRLLKYLKDSGDSFFFFFFLLSKIKLISLGRLKKWNDLIWI